jgi:hypothetical protein
MEFILLSLKLIIVAEFSLYSLLPMPLLPPLWAFVWRVGPGVLTAIYILIKHALLASTGGEGVLHGPNIYKDNKP